MIEHFEDSNSTSQARREDVPRTSSYRPKMTERRLMNDSVTHFIYSQQLLQSYSAFIRIQSFVHKQVIFCMTTATLLSHTSIL